MKCLTLFSQGTWFPIPLLGLLFLVQIACSSTTEITDMTRWSELNFLVDGIIDIQLRVPLEENGKAPEKMQFIGTKYNSRERMFIEAYDQGTGEYRELLMTHIMGVVVRVERKNMDGTNLSHKDIEKYIYLSRPNAAEEFEIVGEHLIAGRTWLRINLVGGTQKRGASFALPIDKNYVFILTMYMYGENADETRLYQKRMETLERVLTTVQVSTIGS